MGPNHGRPSFRGRVFHLAVSVIPSSGEPFLFPVDLSESRLVSVRDYLLSPNLCVFHSVGKLRPGRGLRCTNMARMLVRRA